MSDNKIDNNEMSKPPASVEGADSNVDVEKAEEMAAKEEADVVEDKVSIQQILEGMTNEFNRQLNTPKKIDSDKSPKNNIEQTDKITKHSKVVTQVEKVERADIERQEPEVVKKASEILEKIEDTEQEMNENTPSKVTKKDISPNKESIPRIVLTFRTIDENTDDGRKTKISSCSSNLKLVPDELTNCDQIGGVSVKIENSDDNSNENEDKSDDNEDKGDKDKKPNDVEENNSNSPAAETAEKINDSKKSNKSAESITETKESVPKKRRVGRPRLRALRLLFYLINFKSRKSQTRRQIIYDVKFCCSDSTEESPGPAGPKRSARRLCKESFRSTVLESAMARKEKSNYTDERKFKNERKYSRPGRPKKIVKWKDQNKQTDVKSENSTSHNNSELNGTQEVNTSIENSKNASISEKSKSDLSLDETVNSSTDYDGMPKLSPISKTLDVSQNSSRSVPDSPTMEEDGSANDTDKPFLKPIIGRSKRERGRPKGSGSARKIAKADSPNEGETPGI